MSELGIYFGPRSIGIAETRADKLVNQAQISVAPLKGLDITEEKVPEEIKLAAMLKDALLKIKFLGRSATVCLSGKDLIIRTFDMPPLPAREMISAINFESKKYIPFKLEEVFSASQWKIDKSTNKNRVLYVAVKKEILEKYISVLNQAGLKINSIEPSAFSALRFLKLANIPDKGISAVVSADLFEEDEANFIVLENGFPLFSRDITLAAAYAPGTEKPEETPMPAVLEKLKREIRISLDYYNRKFPVKKIEKIFFISAQDSRQDLDVFTKEVGLPANFVETAKYFGGKSPSLSLDKGYAAALSGRVKTGIAIDLLAAKLKVSYVKERMAKPQVFALPLAAGMNIDSRVLIAGLLLCAAAFGFGFSKVKIAQNELRGVVEMQSQVAAEKAKYNYEELVALSGRYKGKIQAVSKLRKGQLYLAGLLGVIPRIIPENVWLTDLSFEFKTSNKPELRIDGFAGTGDSAVEAELVNSFRAELAQNPAFRKYFKEINIASLDRKLDARANKTITTFSILCRNE